MKKYYAYLITALLTLGIVDANACSCIAVKDEQRFIDASDVFVGTVVETKLITKVEKFGELEASVEQVSAKIEIKNRAKGEPSKHTEVIDSVANGANCGVGLLTGRDYLFYLYDNNLLSICSGTRLYNAFTDQGLIEKMLSN